MTLTTKTTDMYAVTINSETEYQSRKTYNTLKEAVETAKRFCSLFKAMGVSYIPSVSVDQVEVEKDADGEYLVPVEYDLLNIPAYFNPKYHG